MTRKTAKQIRKASRNMTKQELYDFLSNLECKGKITLHDAFYSCEYTIDFAMRMVARMQESLANGEWYGYELKALNALENIPGDENELVWIDNYGYPREIRDNDHFLYVLGIEDQLQDAEEDGACTLNHCMA